MLWPARAQRLRQGHGSGGALAALPALALTPLPHPPPPAPRSQSARTSPLRRQSPDEPRGAFRAREGRSELPPRALPPELSQRASALGTLAPARAQEPLHAASRAGRLAGGPGAELESGAEVREPPPAPLIDLRPSEAGPAGSSAPGRGAADSNPDPAPSALASLEELLGALEGGGPDTPPSETCTSPSLNAAAPCAPMGPAEASGLNGWARFGDALCSDPARGA